MGIDVYLRWDGQTKGEEEAQYTGFSTTHGHVGYLREAYHGGPYATRVLMPEGFGDLDGDGATISSATLRERLPAALEACRERCRKNYGEDPAPECLQAFENFVALHEKLEATGKNPRVIVSA